MKLKPNILGIAGRIALAGCVFGIWYCSLKLGILDRDSHDKMGRALLWFINGGLAWLLLGIIQSFFMVLNVQADTSSGKIKFGRLFSKRIIAMKEITGYFTTVHSGTIKDFLGLIIMTKHASFKLTEVNLNSIAELKVYLEQEAVKYLGEKRTYVFQ